MNPKNGQQEYQVILTWVVWIVSGVYLAAIILLFTPYTHNIDEIKVAIMLSGGSIVWAVYAAYLYFVPHPGSNQMRLLAPLFAFLLVFLISCLFSHARWISWFNLRFYLFTMVMLFVVVSTITTMERLITACSLFTFLALLSCIFGLAHYYGVMDLFIAGSGPSAIQNDWHRLFYTLSKKRNMLGTILNADFFAAYLIMALPAAIALIFAAPQLYNRILGVVTSVCMAGCIYLTKSNETIIAVLAFIVIFIPIYVLRIKDSFIRRHWHISLVIAIGWVVTAMWLTRDQVVNRFGHIADAFASRAIIYSGAWEMFLDRPILGWGPGSFRMVFPLYRDFDYYLHEISNVTLFAHNQFLGLLSETGILGFIFYMWFLVAIAWYLIREIRLRPSSQAQVFQLSFLGGLIAIHIQNFFSPNSRWVAPAIAYYTMLGLAIASGQITRIAYEAKNDRGSWLADFLNRRQIRDWAFIGLSLAIAVMLVTSVPYGFRYFEAAMYNNKGIQYLEFIKHLGPGNQRQVAVSQAIQNFEQALEADPTFLTSYYKLAHAYNAGDRQIKSLETYNDLSYYNEEYSEIHFNYGVILQILYRNGYRINRDRLKQIAAQMPPLTGKEYTLDFEELSKKSNIDSEQVQRVFDIIRSINTRGPTRDISIEEIFEQSPNAGKDRLLLELALLKLEDASQIAHKPPIWATYISVLNSAGYKDKVIEKIEYVFSDDVGKGHLPIYKWRKKEANFLLHKDLFIQMMQVVYPQAGREKELVELLKKLYEREPGNPDYVNTLIFLDKEAAGLDRETRKKYLLDLLRRNPLSWGYHRIAGGFYQEEDERVGLGLAYMRMADIMRQNNNPDFEPPWDDLYHSQLKTLPIAQIYLSIGSNFIEAIKETSDTMELEALQKLARSYMQKVIDEADASPEDKSLQRLKKSAQSSLRQLELYNRLQTRDQLTTPATQSINSPRQ